jgi:hypothetical protein
VASHYRVKETGLVRFRVFDYRRRLMACVTWEVGWVTSPSRNLPERAKESGSAFTPYQFDYISVACGKVQSS